MTRRLLPVSALVAIAALVAVVLPVAAPTSSSTPAPTEHRYALSAKQAVRAGWHADANVSTDMVGVKWSGDPNAKFTVATRDGSGRWSSPVPLDTLDVGPDPGTKEAAHAARLATEPYWVHGKKDVRIALASGAPANVDLHTVNAPGPKVPASSAGASVAWPNVIMRPGWGADESLRFRNCSGPTYTKGVRFAVIHHTVESNNYSPADSFAIVRSIYAYSVLTLGYCDMMYNFLVDKYGQIFEGRAGGVDKPVLGAHAIGFNTDSTGVALIGDYSVAQPSAAAIDAIERLLAWKFAASGIDPRAPVSYTTTGNDKFPAGTHLTIPNIVGHRDTWFTDCPGQALYNWLPAIRENVAERIEHQPVDLYTSWRPVAGAPKVIALTAYGGLYPAGGSPGFVPPAYWPAWQIAKAVKLLPGGGGGYVLDGYGGLHPFGSARPMRVSGYWPGWDIARDFVLLPNGTGGYVLDAFGALHPFGTARAVSTSAYWRGWDIARRVAVLPSGTGGYVLDGWGGVHPFGTAPALRGSPYWKGWDIARDIAVQPGTGRVYVMDGFGGIWPLGGAPRLAVHYFGADVVRGFALIASGGFQITNTGQLFRVGGAPGLVHPFGVISPPYVRELAVAP
jgi:hypothetical protein